MLIPKFLEDIDREDVFWLTVSYLIFAVPAYVIGFAKSVTWLWIIAVVVTVIFGLFLLLVYLSKLELKKKEVEILAKAPNFPQHDYCDSCGKELEGAEERIEGDLRILICPHCGAENVLKGKE